MDMNDIIRGFFGFNRFSPRYPPGFLRDDDDDENDIQHIDDFHDDNFFNVFRQMENMFNNVFSTHSGFLDSPNLEMMPPVIENNPRDFMLKESNEACEGSAPCIGPHCYPSQRMPMKDIDLDDEFSKGGLSALNDELPVTKMEPKTSWSFRKSFSTRVIHSPDGMIEEHKSVTDSDGKTVTTVKKIMGDKTYQVTTTESDKTGLIEKNEDFINMNEAEIDEFKKNRYNTLPSKTPMDEIVAPPGDPKYIQIFKKFFG